MVEWNIMSPPVPMVEFIQMVLRADGGKWSDGCQTQDDISFSIISLSTCFYVIKKNLKGVYFLSFLEVMAEYNSPLPPVRKQGGQSDPELSDKEN